MSLVGLAIVSMFLAITVSDILLILFGIISLIFCVSPVIVASLFWEIKGNAAFLSMLGGALAFIALIVTNNFSPDTSIITLPAAIVFLVIGQIVFRK